MKQKQFHFEPSPRWVRVEFGGEIIADSRNTLLVWDDHVIPAYFFPPEDVRTGFLQPTGRARGPRTIYDLAVNGQEAPNAAWSYTDPDDKREPLNDLVVFRWNKMDHWYEEEEEVFVHARDPYSRVDVIRSSRQVRVELDGVTLAQSAQPTLLFETGLPARFYLPPEDVNMDLLAPTDSHTRCPYKGAASYWSVGLGEKVHKDLVWSYPDPIPEAQKIQGLLSFYNEKVDTYVDGELAPRPQTPWSD